VTEQVISLDAIDFSNPDGEFIFRGETYLLKKYLDNYFIRNKKHVGLKFIVVCFLYPHREEVSTQDIKQSIENNQDYIYRCVQYKEALLGFGKIEDMYYSLKRNGWIGLRHFNYKPHINISLQEVFEKPYESFIEQAAIAYIQELPLIEDNLLFHFFRCKEVQKIEFICGSQLELEKLTKLAALTLPELQHLFEQSSMLTVTYESDNRYGSGGIYEVISGEWDEVSLSKVAEKLFNLIFEHNFFTGIYWEYNDGSTSGYPAYDPHAYDIEIEVQAPSQHERLEAALELRSWLEGKLPEDEIESYFNQ